MLDLRRVLQEEQSRMDAVLEKEVEQLPPQTRAVARHILKAGGKRLRPLLALYMGRVFGCTLPAIQTMAAAIEFVHVATLIHDDVLDNATTRRGAVAAHEIYTPTVAILSGDAMLAHAAQMIARLKDAHISQKFAEAVGKTAAGEIDEFSLQGDAELSHEAYLAMITGKTAWMLQVACELPAYYSGASEAQVEAAARFGLELGIAFQIVDDALDIASAAVTGKPSGGDLRERKCTPLTRFYLEKLSEEKRLAFKEKFRSGSFSEEEVAAIIEEMREMGLGEKTRAMADEHLAAAVQALLLLPENEERDLLALVADYIKQRDR